MTDDRPPETLIPLMRLRWVKRDDADPDCVRHPGWPEDGDSYLVLQQLFRTPAGEDRWVDIQVEDER